MLVKACSVSVCTWVFFKKVLKREDAPGSLSISFSVFFSGTSWSHDFSASCFCGGFTVFGHRTTMKTMKTAGGRPNNFHPTSYREMANVSQCSLLFGGDCFPLLLLHGKVVRVMCRWNTFHSSSPENAATGESKEHDTRQGQGCGPLGSYLFWISPSHPSPV